MDQNLSGGYHGVSLWLDAVAAEGEDSLIPRAALDGDLEADVAIVGAGFTGLWTAYSLLHRDPSIRVAVIEARIAGFGASGRNGGWCSALFPVSTAALERRHGRAAALAMRTAMTDTVDEVGRVVATEHLDCDFAKGGTLAFATTAPQRARAIAEVAEAARYGVDRLESRLQLPPRPGGGVAGQPHVFDPDCARIQPAKLVRGLARAVERAGGVIYESTRAVQWSPHRLATDRGTVRADSIIIAVEGYNATLRQRHRRVLPLYSLMIATEPLPDAVWEEAGIAHGQTFTDYRHLLVYGQRTADNRAAFGGRGARYHWASGIRERYDRAPRVFRHLRRALSTMIPATEHARITHQWGGPLGVPRDWHAAIEYDERTGIGWAGGYVGDGVGSANLAGRTLADLILGAQSELTELPWVGHRSRRWEPEPFRFLGANLGLLGMGIADLEESITRRPSITAKLVGPLIGR